MGLIDADMLKKELAISGSCNNCAYEGIFGCLEDIRASDVCYSIRTAPTVDAVPVVRCKDCKHAERWYGDKYRCFLWNEDGIDVFEDGYCNYGERRDEDDH